ncbi:hypothetical protein HPP92_019868 [Vanilla planifolia]|uniref:Uncharacterized protein n=1 Tax=Vanilla planifolia TaxID=51239 RepID=A0A835Q9T8_VANPL|nr:hypothetical protein HPP92_019868 [Vanilla planifolia]
MGGLATTKDGTLTLLDCFICTSSLDVLHKVFDSAQHREHDRELLYPDACGDGGRSWISQGLTNYGRGHGTREACALHTSSLSCDTLVDFWCALGDETRSSLFQMKEDDFIERLMYRFDSKRFCRDCRRNVLREFKELKELKRLKKELHCTRWFCISDTSIQYELSNESVQADWQHSFTDTHKYHHFEWAIGTAEGKTDILEFENVGLNEKVQANGLNLRHLSACFITVRAWKLDGRCIEICVKAHALKGQACVHRRLIVGDGFVSITKGDSIRSFFEHAEEIEEEEDDDYVDKDGNELDGDGSRPQKHAKSPELMREFLLDTATVIFKEQVEKAFREGTTRQNAHILFVSLAIKLLEEQLHVACKEIISIQKQIKLLEEEKMKSVRKMSAGRGGEQRAGKETKKEGTAGKKERSSGKQNQFNLRNLIPQNLTTSANEYDKPVNLCSDSKPSIEKMAYARVTQVVQSHMRHDTNLPVTSREMNIWHDCGLKNSSMSLTRGTKTNRERVVRQRSEDCKHTIFKGVIGLGGHQTTNTITDATLLFGRDSLQTRQIWEPMDATRKKYVKSNLDIDVTLSNAAMIQCSEEIRDSATSNGSSFPGNQNISPSHQLGTVEAALTHKPFTSSYTEASLQKEDPKKGSINSFGAGFKYEIAPPQLQIPEMNNQLPLSRLPSEVLDLQPKPCFMVRIWPAQIPSMECSSVHTITCNNRSFPSEAASDWSSENKESASELTSSIKLASNSNIMADESSKPFSLFHFGGPLFDSAAC